jgi:hypothetical protein
MSNDHLFDDFKTHWFGDEVIHASRQTAVPFLAHRRRGHGHDGYVDPYSLFPADLRGGLQAGHLGHLNGQAADNAVEKGGSERWMVRSKKNNQTKIGSPDKAKGRFLLRETALSPIF